ncbi:MAG: sugar transferase, partial [Candidatus Omnitrophica bacterium]|nr:sugar transferase [Candidatus Omnitrophota bacterium]
QRRKYVYFVYLGIDIFLITFSFYLPYFLRYNRSIIPSNLPYFKEYSLLFLVWGVTLIFLLNNYRLFSTDRSVTIPKEFWMTIKCVFFSSLLAGLVVFLLQMMMFSRLVFGQAIILLILTLSFWRAFKRTFIRYRVAHGYHNINVLIVGAGRTAKLLVKEIEKQPYLGIRVVGFLDDNKFGKVMDYSVLGKINDLSDVVQQYFVDEIYVTIPSERKKVAEVLAVGKRLNKAVRILADNFTISNHFEGENNDKNNNGIESLGFGFPFMQLRLHHIGYIPLISYIETGQQGIEIVFKRVMDILISAIGLILLTPLFVLIAFLIKIDSPGPVFYVSLRCGKKGRVFKFYKFRSMFVGADNYKESLRDKSDVKGPVFKIKNDPRVTRLGRLLRRYSLDELPQLINVFKGDMSLVGPRPPTPDEVEKYDIWQMRRLEVKPGLTCLWQVRGRSDLSFYKWVKWDLWYIDNWSLRMDLLILLWTIPAVLKRKGAY